MEWYVYILVTILSIQFFLLQLLIIYFVWHSIPPHGALPSAPPPIVSYQASTQTELLPCHVVDIL